MRSLVGHCSLRGLALWQSLLIEQPTGRHLDCTREFFHRRNLRVAFAPLDPADLSRLNAAAFGDLFLGQTKFLAGSPEVLAEVAHAVDRPRSEL